MLPDCALKPRGLQPLWSVNFLARDSKTIYFLEPSGEISTWWITLVVRPEGLESVGCSMGRP